VTARLDRAEVLAFARARVPGILSGLELKGKASAGQWRTSWCPLLGAVHSRPDAVAIAMSDGRWQCFPCGKGGDVVALVAGCHGLDAERDFPVVLERIAELSGHVPAVDPGEAAWRRAELARRAAVRVALEDASKRERDQQARVVSSEDWARCTARHAAGEAYAESRGIAALVGHDVFRFGARGELAVPLFASDGAIVNVVRRNLPGTEPKVSGKRACPTLGTFARSLADIVGGRDVVIVEGVVDAVTACLVWPEAVVLGAHGAANIPKLTPHVAKRVALARTRLYLVPHLDAAGLGAVHAAVRAAIGCGLALGTSLHVLSVRAGETRFKDLNEAWCAGWRKPLADAAVPVPGRPS
jgi:hypothetical protein